MSDKEVIWLKCAERAFKILVHPRLVYHFTLETYALRTSNGLIKYLWTLSLALDLAWKSSCGHLHFCFHQHFFPKMTPLMYPSPLPGFSCPPGDIRSPALSQHTLPMCRLTCLLKCTRTVMCNRLLSDGLWFRVLALSGPSCEVYRHSLTHEEIMDPKGWITGPRSYNSISSKIQGGRL